MRTLTAPILEGTDIQKQIERESYSIAEGIKNYREEVRSAMKRGDGTGLVPVMRLMAHWFSPLREAIRLERRRCINRESGTGRDVYGPTMRMLSSDQIAGVTLNEVMLNLLEKPEGQTAAVLSYNVGKAMLAEINLDLLQLKHRKESAAMREAMRHMKPADKMAYRQNNLTDLEMLTKMARSFGVGRVNWWAKKTLEDPVWSRKVCCHLGMVCLWHLKMTASCGDYGEDKPFVMAFDHFTVWERTGKKNKDGSDRLKKVSYFKLTDEAYQLIDDGHHARQALRPAYMPMIAPPVKWTKDRGGYYVTKTPLISRMSKERQPYIKNAEMPLYYQGVDNLNAVPMQINGWILDIQQRMYADGGGVAQIPPLHDMPFPDKVDDPSPEQLQKAKQERAIVWHHNKSLRGLRTVFEMTHAMARDLVEHDAFYQVHQADFRGRLYPVQPVLDHQGSDLTRSLFQFATPKPVSETGRKWMKITMADLWGFKGLSQVEACQVIDSAMSEIEQWAHDPFQYDGWMRTHNGKNNKRKAWQCLAMAWALVDDDAAAHIPIQPDGTCNGIQHYAAMGRDLSGAIACNLAAAKPEDKPNSIYVDVAKAVLPLVEADAAAGDEMAAFVLDRVTLDHACAKCVVMPAVYGMTAVGARKAMYAHLDDSGIEGDMRYKVSMYLGRQMREALAVANPPAVEAMDWMQQMARLIAKGKKRPVSWTTPLGFPVIQTYRSKQKTTIQTIAQQLTLQFEDQLQPVRVGQQVDGFAPNFVHSIDSTHLVMVANAAAAQGIDMACIHDAYWTHAEDGDRLGQVLREQFVELHKQPLLHNLRDELCRLHPDIKFPDTPSLGQFDINDTLQATYLFS